LNFFKAPQNQTWTAQFLRQPTPGTGMLEDPIGDFVHSSGDTPGFTPDHLDIVAAWLADVTDGGPLFGPTDGTDTIWEQGSNELTLPDGSPVRAYTYDGGTFDGSQFANGAYLFAFDTRAMPPAVPPGRCEFVIWVNDTSRTDTFENMPAYPLDPAGGTNKAFGIGLNPEGQGVPGTFALDLTDQGFFAPQTDWDVRGVMVGSDTTTSIGIFVPMDLVGALGGVNYYTFCVREGSSFDAADTGSDQTGLIDLGPNDPGILAVSLVSTTTTTATTTTTTTSTTTTTVAASPTTTTATTGTSEGGGFPWGLVLLGGVGLAIAGWFLYRKPGSPCAEELAAWKAAQARCGQARSQATEAEQKCGDAKEHTKELKKKRAEVCRDWPPACWSSDDGDWVEDDQGNRVTSRDLHMRKMALGELWDDYQAGLVPAEKVEEIWRKAETPEFREQMRQRDAKAKAELKQLNDEIPKAEAHEKEACAKAKAAQQAANDACAAAEAARRRYEECVGRATTPPPGPETGGETGPGPSGPSTPGVTGGTPGSTTQPRDPCEGQPPKKAVQDGEPDPIDVVVDFSMFIEADPASKHGEDHGEQMVIDLSMLAQELDMVGDLLSAREAGLHIAGGVNGYAAGRYVAGTAGVVRGGVEATLAGTNIIPDIPTSIPTATVELLESVSKFAGFVAGRVTDWMKRNEMVSARVTFFKQTIIATPYRIMECRKGQGWVCVERVWEIEVSKLQKDKRKLASQTWRPVSDLDRHRMNADFRRLGSAAANQIKQDANRLAKWRARHEPGPCQ
ncbi:MAG: hypothetical protein WAM81_11100, partial [Acidimicrobiia bacterium]